MTEHQPASARTPASESATAGVTTVEGFGWEAIWSQGEVSEHWSHSGIAVLPDGRAVFAHPAGRDLVIVDPDSGAMTQVETPLLEIHGITLDVADAPDVGRPVLWLADPGLKAEPDKGYDVHRQAGRAIRFELDGSHRELDPPDGHSGAEPWRPTSIVAAGDGSIWVADGYGHSLVHVYDRDGRHRFSLDGTETGQRLACPHGLAVDTRHDPQQIAVADRGNRRVVFYALDGRPLRTVTDPATSAPSCLAIGGDDLIVTDLHGGLYALDRDDHARPLVPRTPQDVTAPWPNDRSGGRLVRPHLAVGRLRSPHAVAVGPDGSIYLTEWLIGGRVLRLRPQPAGS